MKLIALLLIWSLSAPAFAKRVQTEIRPPEQPIQLLPPGTTARIAQDWSSREPLNDSQPDRTTKSIWIRMFPIVLPPYNDPYPPTVDQNNIDLANDGGFDVYSLQTAELLGSATAIHFDFTRTTFALDTGDVPLQAVWVTPKAANPSSLSWDKGKSAEVGIHLRGGFVVQITTYKTLPGGKPTDGGGNSVDLWSVTNVTDVEHYLFSVVPSEAEASWHPAALQAQAVAARTYALNRMAASRAKGHAWDLDPTTWYQSFRGIDFMDRDGSWGTIEKPSTTAGTQNTAGEVLLYNGELIEAYFSDNSGGTTCLASECFQQPDVPYLQQVMDAKGVQNVTGGTWGDKADITPATITKILTDNALTPASPVVKLAALNKGPSGRVWQLRVVLKKGYLDLDEDQSKKLMPLFGTVRSFLYKLESVKSGKQGIVGHGFGHGVGMSQEGAELYAISGWSAHKILLHFFPNTTIGSLFAFP